ncbi:MAG: YajQ family cyclic di-GMP-binding protein [Candidatus Puniceispirillales bacterium]
MPSFDIVSKPDLPSINNAIDGVQREISTRYDFKGSQSKVEISENVITITADDELKRKQVEELLNTHVTRQKVDSKFLNYEKIEIGSGNTIRQIVEVKTGVAREDAQKIIKLVKSVKSKVQIQIQGDELRVSGKKRDELQSVIAFIKDKFDYIPLQYINFRD